MAATDPRNAAGWHWPARHEDNGRTGPRGVRVIGMRPAGRHARDRGRAPGEPTQFCILRNSPGVAAPPRTPDSRIP